jgi:hypothetical protein
VIASSKFRPRLLDGGTSGAKALEIVPLYGSAEAAPYHNRRESGDVSEAVPCPKSF